jgi:hypothetical protein
MMMCSSQMERFTKLLAEHNVSPKSNLPEIEGQSYCIYSTRVAVPHNFYEAPAPNKNLDETPASSPYTLLFNKPKEL